MHAISAHSHWSAPALHWEYTDIFKVGEIAPEIRSWTNIWQYFTLLRSSNAGLNVWVFVCGFKIILYLNFHNNLETSTE